MVQKFIYMLFFAAIPTFASVSITPNMTTPQIQSALTSAPAGSAVSFAAGNYSITAPLAMPCTNLQVSGPFATPATAILTATFTNNALFWYPANCLQLGSMAFLGIVSNGGVYFSIGNNANFSFTHNQVTGLQTSQGLFFDGTLQTTLSNVTILYNTFGDPNSCAAIFASVQDMGGYCSGITTSQGADKNIDIEYNTFNHVEEGIHFNQMANYNPGQPSSVCVTCKVSNNYVLHYHRIGIEMQMSTPTDSLMLEHNAVIDPLNSSWGTFAVSLACCQFGYTFGTNGFSPGYVFNDNVLISTQPPGSKPPPYGAEFWGTGSQGLNSLVQGNFSNGYTWGYGAGNWAINNNYICGPNYVSQGGYISNQQGQSNPPAQTGNMTGTSCQSKASVAPTVSPAAGTYTTPQTVTLSNAGANTSTWYTLDGTTPVAGRSTLYTAPFTVSQTATLKAVGMWGNAIQPTSYPAGYGYTPSAMLSAAYTINNQPPPVQNCTQQILNPQAGTYKSTTIPCPAASRRGK